MMTKIYPRTGDKQTVYLNAVVKDPRIEVGDYTIYNVVNQRVILPTYCRAFGKLLPSRWQSFANAVAKSCQEGGKTLPTCRQEKIHY